MVKKTISIATKIKNTLNTAYSEDYIVGHWSNSKKTSNNWGDAINPFIFEKLSGKKVINIKSIYNIRKKPVYTAVGSILDNSILSRIENLKIWGSGFKKENFSFNVKNVDIYAVRGPLTRKKLIKSGFDCPKIYGDPALLFPMFYKNEVKKKYQLGIIPHYVDKEHKLVEKFYGIEGVKVIDITSGIKNVVDQVLSCEVIASSSLHGLILPDAYDIPSIWIKFSDNISGGNFKFHDYFLSVERNDRKPIIMNEGISKNQILDSLNGYKIQFDRELLLKSCPFRQM